MVIYLYLSCIYVTITCPGIIMLLMYLITYASIVSCSSVTFNTSGTVQWVFYAILSVMSFTLINKEFSHSLHVY